LADIFEDWKGPMLSSQGTSLNDQWLHVDRGRRLSMDNVRVRLFELIQKTPHLNWLILTKRPENIRRMIAGAIGACRLPNVWLGVSIDNQEFADKRIPELLKCRDISPVLFLSCEPLVGEVDLKFDAHPGMATILKICEWESRRIDWVIAGGESGPNPRASDPNWFRSLRDQCKTADVPFFFKQWGEIDEHGVNVGKVEAGRLLDGVLHDEFPKVNR
jgi:protein gp37